MPCTPKLFINRIYNEAIDVADPLSAPHSMGRIENIKILPGYYKCLYHEVNGEIKKLEIFNRDYLKSHTFKKFVNNINVHNKLVGFFEHSNYYSLADKNDFQQLWLTKQGFCASLNSKRIGKVYTYNTMKKNVVGICIQFK